MIFFLLNQERENQNYVVHFAQKNKQFSCK